MEQPYLGVIKLYLAWIAWTRVGKNWSLPRAAIALEISRFHLLILCISVIRSCRQPSWAPGYILVGGKTIVKQWGRYLRSRGWCRSPGYILARRKSRISPRATRWDSASLRPLYSRLFSARARSPTTMRCGIPNQLHVGKLDPGPLVAVIQQYVDTGIGQGLVQFLGAHRNLG